MAAPKGNKFAYGNPNTGRPATWTKEIIEKEAELLMKWCRKESSLILRKFACLRGYTHAYIYKWSDPNDKAFSEVFYDAFHFAKSVIGTRREELDIVKFAQRDMGMHFEELEAFERDREKFKSKLKQKENEVQALTLAELNKMSKNGELSQK